MTYSICQIILSDLNDYTKIIDKIIDYLKLSLGTGNYQLNMSKSLCIGHNNRRVFDKLCIKLSSCNLDYMRTQELLKKTLTNRTDLHTAWGISNVALVK